MKKWAQLTLMVTILSNIAIAEARNDKLMFSISEALNSAEAKQVLNPNIPVQFASGGGRIIKSGLVSNKKTNSVGKSDEVACRWAFLSSVAQFQKTAVQQQATKVVNVISYYDRHPYMSSTQYECHAGGIMAGVVLKGDIAR